METFLEQGIAFYFMALLLGIGIMMKWMVQKAYVSLTRQTEDMAHVTSEWLRQLKSKYESSFKKYGDVPNAKALIDKAMGKYRIFGLRVFRADQMLLHTSVICMLATLCLTFMSFYYEMNLEVILRQIFVGVMFSGFAFYFDMIIETDTKKEMLMVHLLDYFDNTLFFKMSNDASVLGSGKGKLRDDIFITGEKISQRDDTMTLHGPTVVEVMASSKEEQMISPAGKQTAVTMEKDHIIDMIRTLVDKL